MDHGDKDRAALLAEIERLRRRLESIEKNACVQEKEAAAGLAERLRAEELLHSVVEGTASVSGEEYFRSLVRNIATALNCRYAFVGEMDTVKKTVRMIAFWADGGFQSPMEYSIIGTPCEEVVGKRLCWHKSGAKGLFPRDSHLEAMGVESYIGAPLFDSTSRPLGLLVAMDGKEMPEKPDLKPFFSIFAARAALELERKRYEDALKKSDEVLHAIMDQTTAVIFMKDREGRFLFVNSWYEKLLGLKRECLIGKTDHEVFPKALADKFRENDLLVARTGGPLEFEELVLHPDGVMHTYIVIKFPISEMGGAVCGIATDISERKRTEEELKRNTGMLNHAQRLANIGCWEWDVGTGALFWSDEHYRIAGIDPSLKVDHEAFLNCVHPEDRDYVRAYTSEVMEKGAPSSYSLEYRIKRPDGTVRYVQSRGDVTLGPDGRTSKLSGTMQDITERKLMEAEILKAQKLESIGVLAGGIAHDFNNLLLGVIGNVSLAKTYFKSGERVFTVLDDIERAATRAKSLTRQLLTFSRGGDPIREDVRMEQLVKDAASLVVRGTHAACEFSFQEGLWPAVIDEGQITQVINNIVLNAVQAMPQGGKVRIEAGNLEVGSDSALPLNPGRYLRVSFRDSGHGIPPETINKVFDPFFTTRQRASGLGLAVSYSVVKKHKGCITVESSPGRGACFNVYLPAGEAPAVRANAPEKLATGSGRILVLDDEELVRDVTGEMLKLLGYEVEFACEGKEALEKLIRARDSGHPFDGAILDLTIPGGMGGKEAIGLMLQAQPGLKAIVSSGYSKDPIMSDYKRYGFHGVIAKPYRVAEFSRIVKEVVTGA